MKPSVVPGVQKSREEDPWLGGESGSARYTPKQRRDMIAACVERNGHVGCNCKGCPIHPGQKCFLWLLPDGVDAFRVLTPHHLSRGPGDHHLSNLDAFCEPCNRSTGQVSTQRSVCVRKSPGAGRATVGGSAESSVRLVQRHEWERPAWDEWVKTDAPWKRLKEEGLMEGEWTLLQDLVDLAAGELEDPTEGKGSSVTFRRYAMEDRFGVLEMAKTRGRLYVRLRREGRQK